MSTIQDSIARVHDRIAAAAGRAGRDPADIGLVAVSKGILLDAIDEALDAGVTILGENKVQEARQKHPHIAGRAEFHMVGHLQSNKAGRAVEMFDMIQSVDSERIARALDSRAAASEKHQRVLVEVNTSGDVSKFGVDPENLISLMETLAQCPHLRVEGLMTIGPLGGGEAGARAAFETLRSLLPCLRESGLAEPDVPQLSMGMSGDFEAAIEEGATLVRVGTAIFGPRRTGRP